MRRNIQSEVEKNLARADGRTEKYLHRALIIFVFIVLLFMFIIGEMIPDTVL